MSRWSKYGTRDDEEDNDPLLTSSLDTPAATSKTSPAQRFHPYTVVGFASAVIVGVILIVAVTMNESSSASIRTAQVTVADAKTAKSTSYYQGTKRTSFAAFAVDKQKKLFEDFKKKFNRQYKTKEEEELRFKVFQDFLGHIDDRNGKEANRNGKANHGITRFADMSQEEFKKGYLKYKRSSDKGDARKNLKLSPFTGKSKKEKSLAKKADSTPTSVDWSGVYTTSVKDQGYCGSCWAFSAAQQLESDGIRNGFLTTSDALSPQQIVSCDTIDYGCDGGDTVTAYVYVYSAGGITSEAQYPYKSYWGTTYSCNIGSDTKLVKPVSYYLLTSEDALEEFVLTTGPASICVDASEWSSYTSGIISSCGMSVDHCVQVVGVDTESGFWKVRNSWGTSWGDNGYIYLATGKNMCNIASEPTYVDLVKV
jgi:C1A family cysteine protease